jgi:REP element-mobilizing transposase RayT
VARPFARISFPFRYCGCPVLAFFARAGIDAADTMGFAMPSGLHRTYGAHHLHFITCSCYRRLPFLKPARSRDRFLAILEQVRKRYRFVVVGYVVMPEHIHLLITEPEMGSPSTVMQVLQAAHRVVIASPAQAERPAAGQAFRRRFSAAVVLAGALLRLQCMEDKEARGEVEVHASQSGEARIGRVAGTMALEQLSLLFSR